MLWNLTWSTIDYKQPHRLMKLSILIEKVIYLTKTVLYSMWLSLLQKRILDIEFMIGEVEGTSIVMNKLRAMMAVQQKLTKRGLQCAWALQTTDKEMWKNLSVTMHILKADFVAKIDHWKALAWFLNTIWLDANCVYIGYLELKGYQYRNQYITLFSESEYWARKVVQTKKYELI